MRRTTLVLTLAVLPILASVSIAHEPVAADTTIAESTGLPDFESAPKEARRIDFEGLPDRVSKGIDAWFEGHGTRRVYVQLDRPMYRPGETIWLKSFSVTTRALAPDEREGVLYELVNPRGTVGLRVPWWRACPTSSTSTWAQSSCSESTSTRRSYRRHQRNSRPSASIRISRMDRVSGGFRPCSKCG